MKTVYLFDTDHISFLDRGGRESKNIQRRMLSAGVIEVFASVISYEEQIRGWMSQLARIRNVERQINDYLYLEQTLQFYCATPSLHFDHAAVEHFQRLWTERIGIGTMDMKIASIALANNATLLSRNLSDYSKVPDLRVEDWSA